MIKIGFVGDIMIGRLVNEVLRQKSPEYIWGNVLPLMQQTDLVIANLEAALTYSEQIVPKVFNFKSDPEHVEALSIANIRCVNLANNHVLDFDQEGLLETLTTLEKAGIAFCGAGRTRKEAKKPCILDVNGIKIAVLGFTDNEPSWVAQDEKPGTNYIRIGEDLQAEIAGADIVIASIHWGPNMIERPPKAFISFAHKLIDWGVDIIHGHSAHIFQGIEMYKNRPILYDTGDFVDDYHVDPVLRNDRSFFFVVTCDKSGPVSVELHPVLISNCQVNLATDNEALTRMKLLSKERETSFFDNKVICKPV